MDVGTTLISRTKAAKSMQPRVGSLDDPADFTQTAAMGFATPGDGTVKLRSIGYVPASRIVILIR
ncbi:hypothetical protein OKW35_002393 [Paraburkholderia sp. MM5477-R1]